jgi:radical SAM protein with 4Fe4S-binding SPASM domain
MRSKIDQPENLYPYFPYKLYSSGNGDGFYYSKNHLTEKPVKLNRQAAELLRYANGVLNLAEISEKIANRYEVPGEFSAIQSKILDFLEELESDELIWWRNQPVDKMYVEPPVSIFWEITAACNLRCLHCVVAAGKKSPGELSLERCIDLAGELAEAGVQSIAFSGGEPLIHPHFYELVETVKKNGMMVQVSTNGTLVDEVMSRWLLEIGAEIQVSLDGSKPELHNHMRPGVNAFERALTGITHLVTAGHEVTIGTVVSKINLEDIPSILILAEELGAACFRLIPFVPKGRGGEYCDLEVPPHEMKRITQFLMDARESTSVTISELEFEEMLNGSKCIKPLDLHRSLGCSGAVSYATITPTGELLPCHFFEGVRADSVKNHSFEEVWYRSRFLNYFRSLNIADLHGKCRECSWLAKCGGSCRAINFSKGDFLGGNSQCWIAEENTIH